MDYGSAPTRISKCYKNLEEGLKGETMNLKAETIVPRLHKPCASESLVTDQSNDFIDIHE